MKNQLKLNVIILISSIFLTSQAVAADRILPIPKPTVDQAAKEKTAKKKKYTHKKNRQKKLKKFQQKKLK